MPNAPEPQLSLETIVDTIAALEKQHAAVSVTGTDRVQQKATLQFLASLKELVRSFCLQGSGDEECSYICYYLRGK